ncbi:UDP-N-acetylmuramoyl-L-alanyl-D-glutamate--2,6-diaminopimelate ligase [Pseudarthrobacter sp. J1738]|uniref:UDP-N-acetylmuramoyl-L-alanyl-D-glutamate--2, 6-diaminopimelate ligase n=1 Tax=Pseudarthrobacter sp. J1738 TaxID=3420446 RepID=UPI003D2E94DB
MSDQSSGESGQSGRSPFRPSNRTEVSLEQIAQQLSVPAPGAAEVTGITSDSRGVEPGDLYVALPGANRHGADFAAQAAERGAAAVLTDQAGARALALDTDFALPVLVTEDVRAVVGPLAGLIYGSQPEGVLRPDLFAVTGTNGKTTTSYFVNSLLRSLGKTTGLIGTIEIVAGGEPIPSKLTTPESTDVHALLALMRERGIDGASMEVSSHALSYHRVDGVHFDVAGFTNLTQDHLDLHGTMDEYFATKAELFTPEHTGRAVILVDDEWGQRLATQASVPVTTVSVASENTYDADWKLSSQQAAGLGTDFVLTKRDGQSLAVHSGLPGNFNVANAALAVQMVLESGVPLQALQTALDTHDPLTVEVPGRMQMVGTSPAAIVDFAHNPDALARALGAVRSGEEGSRVIVVFGATGQRDQGKRPTMGAIAVELADVVIITDDDPHEEDEASIRADVMAGAIAANEKLTVPRVVEEVSPRKDAIRRAVELATAKDTILVAGRGHEVWQEVKGVNLPLDDRAELRNALTAFGFNASSAETLGS